MHSHGSRHPRRQATSSRLYKLEDLVARRRRDGVLHVLQLVMVARTADFNRQVPDFLLESGRS